MSKSSFKQIFFLAGEASADNLACRVITDIKKRDKSIDCIGFGGKNMQKAGMRQIKKIGALDAHGIFGAITNYPGIFFRILIMKHALKKHKPDMFVAFDIPGISSIMARFAKKHNIPCYQVIAPPVWAYDAKSVKKYCQLFLKIFCVFKFEPSVFNKEVKNKACYIGHPAYFLQNQKVDKLKKNQICILPGSRYKEVKRHYKIIKSASHMLRKEIKGIQFVMPTLPKREKMIKEIFKDLPFIKIIVDDDKKYKAMRESSLAWTKMGTAGLELAMMKCPQILFYRFNPLDWLLIKRFVLTKYFSLVNILAKKEIVPELIQDKFSEKNLIKESLALLKTEKSLKQIQQIEKNAIEHIKPPESQLPEAIVSKYLVELLKNKLQS